MEALAMFAVMATEAMVVSKSGAQRIRDLPLTEVGRKFPPELIEAIKEMQATAIIFLEIMETVDHLAGEALSQDSASKV